MSTVTFGIVIEPDLPAPLIDTSLPGPLVVLAVVLGPFLAWDAV